MFYSSQQRVYGVKKVKKFFCMFYFSQQGVYGVKN